MSAASARWEQMYNQVPLQDVPRHFAGIRQSPFMLQYLSTILERCPPGGRTLETGIGSGYGAIWLALRGIRAEGLDYVPGIVERARLVGNILGGKADFRVGDLFTLYDEYAPRYDVIHHQGVLEHFTAPQIRAALAQQVCMADRVVFSIPSVYYPFAPEFGDERLLPLEVWRWLLSPFDIEELRYYGDPQLGGQEHVLCVLRGQTVNDSLLSLMTVPTEPYRPGITVIVHTRNEEKNIRPCLETLRFAAQVIVCDMESSDRTIEIAREMGALVVAHPLIPHFDRSRNVSALFAECRYVMFVDADERVPAALGESLNRLALDPASDFAGLLIPFKHFFVGHWMQCLFPGYTAPRLLKNGKFVFNARLHSGAQVDGPIVNFPPDPERSLVHYSFDSMAHYLEKLNRYTDGEASDMHRDGQPFHWQNAIRHFVHDLQAYYDQGRAHIDGVHGFLYSFMSGFYRFEQHAKLFEKRFQAGQLQPAEQAVPGSVVEFLRFALAVAEQKPPLQATEIQVSGAADAVHLVWSGPFRDPSGTGEESRNFGFALHQAGVPLAVQTLPWSHDPDLLTPEEEKLLQEWEKRPVAPGFTQIVQDFPPSFRRHPQAGRVIGRAMFETDRLRADWVKACNQMDEIWVPSQFNRETFRQSGVAAEKLVVVPGCFDPAPFLTPYEPTPLTEDLKSQGKILFLTVFDWTRHKGWDILLKAFLHAFEGRTDVMLILKVWSTMGYDAESIKAQASAYVQKELGQDLLTDPRIRFVTEKLTRQDLTNLYKACDAYVMSSRGEGWGRPYMEAMACGLPTIGTNWGGNTALMNSENCYLISYCLAPVPEIGWKEIPTYKGHRWAELDSTHLIETLQHLVENRTETTAKGALAREEVCTRFSREVVGKQIAALLEGGSHAKAEEEMSHAKQPIDKSIQGGRNLVLSVSVDCLAPRAMIASELVFRTRRKAWSQSLESMNW